MVQFSSSVRNDSPCKFEWVLNGSFPVLLRSLHLPAMLPHRFAPLYLYTTNWSVDVWSEVRNVLLDADTTTSATRRARDDVCFSSRLMPRNLNFVHHKYAHCDTTTKPCLADPLEMKMLAIIYHSGVTGHCYLQHECVSWGFTPSLQ